MFEVKVNEPSSKFHFDQICCRASISDQSVRKSQISNKYVCAWNDTFVFNQYEFKELIGREKWFYELVSGNWDKAFVFPVISVILL
jgi:hypothetical protein